MMGVCGVVGTTDLRPAAGANTLARREFDATNTPAEEVEASTHVIVQIVEYIPL